MPSYGDVWPTRIAGGAMNGEDRHGAGLDDAGSSLDNLHSLLLSAPTVEDF
jgi:hypothetical protein